MTGMSTPVVTGKWNGVVEFGKWLQKELDQRGWSQGELQRRMRLSPGHVSQWINNKRGISRRNCQELADVLGVPVDDVLRAAGHEPESTQVPLTGRQRPDENLLRRVELKLDAVIAERSGEVAVRQLGRVPADALRWAEWEHEERTLSVPMDWLGSRSADEHFILEASGDCLVQRGIISGSEILCRRLDGETPRHDQIVVVRIDDEYTLKVWCIEDGHIRLRDGEGQLIAELDDRQNVAVIGVVVRIMTAG